MNWQDLWMRNAVTKATLDRLVAAGKLPKEDVDDWVKERFGASGCLEGEAIDENS